MAHHCHATNCKISVPPEMFMCQKHWFTLPKRLRNLIWASYRKGQCDDMNPSNSYCEAAKQCVIFIAKKEGIEPNVRLYDMFLRRIQ